MRRLLHASLLTLALGALTFGCAFIHKTFGPTIGADEIDCLSAELKPLEDAALPTLTRVVNDILTGNVLAALGDLEDKAFTTFGQAGKDAMACAEAKLAEGYAAAHAADAGTAAPTAPGTTSLQANIGAPQTAFRYAVLTARVAALPKKPVHR